MKNRLFALSAILVAATAFAAPIELISPRTGETVCLSAPERRAFLEKSLEECRVVFDAYPCTCTCEKVEAYVKAFGFTDADIAKFRSIMLED